MLTEPEIKELAGIIYTLGEPSMVPMTLDAYLHPDIVPIMQRPMAYAAWPYIEEAIRVSIRLGGAFEPPAIVHLCEQIEATGIPIPFDFRRVRTGLGPKGRFEYLVVSGNRPYVGGTQLRSSLQELASSRASRTVIALAGDWASGKTYSNCLLEEHCNDNQSELLISFDATGFGSGFGPADLATTLINYLGGDQQGIVSPHQESPDTNPNAWYNTLVNRIIGAANRAMDRGRYSRIWFFIDGLGEVENAPAPNRPDAAQRAAPRADLVGFIKALTNAMTVGMNKRNFRLIVSGLEIRLHEQFPGKVVRHEMEPVDENDVRRFIEFRVGNSEAEEGEREALVQAMMDMLSETKSGNHYDLPKLHRALEAI